ncbi:MobQ family relaxase, partial [Camelimonas fluminis]|uniref:MobQ family relaxase n=1 Tax=Camelimonas fluminis TaxID=1576911 RepID=UPI0027E48A49
MQTLRVCARQGRSPAPQKMRTLKLAIYHLSVKTISRSAGRSATPAAAYRSGSHIRDERTGEVHDYRRRKGVMARGLIQPHDSPFRSRGGLWNAAEMAERRINSTVAREYELALPAELDRDRQVALATAFARYLVQTYRVGADIAVHAPSGDGDRRNVHAHILTTTRVVEADGIGAKTRILDAAKTGSVEISRIREHWATMVNTALREAGIAKSIDHRSFEARGLEASATVHLGPALTAVERRRRR